MNGLVDAQMIQDTERFKMDLAAGLQRTLQGQIKPSEASSQRSYPSRPYGTIIESHTDYNFSDHPMFYSPSLYSPRKRPYPSKDRIHRACKDL